MPNSALGAFGFVFSYLFRPDRRNVTLLIGVLAALAFAAIWTWRRVGPESLNRDEYLLTSDAFELTPAPSFVKKDISNQVLVDGKLMNASILDTNLAERIDRALKLQPLIRSVHRISKQYPRRVFAEVEYRLPVAVVEVTSKLHGHGIIPIDRDGVVLDPKAFDESQTLTKFLRIKASGEYPLGDIGAPWGDPVVEQAALIAAKLSDHWDSIGLNKIEAVSERSAGVKQFRFNLLNRQGHVIRWGRAPGMEAPGEPIAEEKLRALADFVANQKKQSPAAPGLQLDLERPISRPGDFSGSKPRTEEKPDPRG